MKQYLFTVIKRIWADIRRFWIGLLGYTAYHFFAMHFLGSACPMIYITGFSCPACGITRALTDILKFDFEGAYYLNPVSFLWFVFFLYFFIVRYFFGKKAKGTDLIFIILIVLLIVRYIYGMVNWFPNRIPYVYSRRNLIQYIFIILNKT